MTFKIAHLSDLHMGYKSTKLTNSQGLNLREADGYLALASTIKGVIDQDADAVVITGDIFHTPKPEMRTIIFVQNQLRRLWAANIPVYMLTGNHDTNDIRADISASRVLHDPDRKIYSHFEPYVKYEISDGIHLHLISHHHYIDQAATMSSIKPIDNEVNIFATHGSVIDPILKIKLHTAQSPREIVIPDYMFDDFGWDYTLLGHIHTRGWVGSKDPKADTNGTKIYYNGSLIRRGFSDDYSPLGRGCTIWTIGADKLFTPHYHTVSQRPQVDLPIVDSSGKTTSEISEAIIQNLVSTQTNGTTFDTAVAPILRQRITGIDPSKFSALDLKAINLNANHALHWNMKIVTPDTDDDKSVNVDADSFESTDVVKIYDKWITGSDRLSRTNENLKEIVTQQAREFVELGQEVTLNE